MEQTLVMIKPDGMSKKLAGQIIAKLEKEGLSLKEMKLMSLTNKIGEKFYQDTIKNLPHLKKALLDYITRSPTLALKAEGVNAINIARAIRGSSDPSKVEKGSIRGDFAERVNLKELAGQGRIWENIMHASGDKEEAQKECALIFNEPN
ncbi:MAG: nucleoside-diphosphate kinase [Nanoarchaeota archaeon]|nr:nucleoside-diphosphate kinase [Nanoarchaeota archaeon]